MFALSLPPVVVDASLSARNCGPPCIQYYCSFVKHNKLICRPLPKLWSLVLPPFRPRRSCPDRPCL